METRNAQSDVGSEKPSDRWIAETRQDGTGGVQGVLLPEQRRAKTGGEVQGKADVPTMFTMLSDILLRAHASIAPGLKMESCTLKHKVKHHSIAFVDNVTGRVTAGLPNKGVDPEQEDTASKIVAPFGTHCLR